MVGVRMGKPAGHTVEPRPELVNGQSARLELGGKICDPPHHAFRRAFPHKDIVVKQPVAQAVYALFHVEDVRLAVLKPQSLGKEGTYATTAFVKDSLVVSTEPEVVAVTYIVMDFQLVLAEQVKLCQKEVPVPHAGEVADWRVFAARKGVDVVLKQGKEFLVTDFPFVLVKKQIMPY